MSLILRIVILIGLITFSATGPAAPPPEKPVNSLQLLAHSQAMLSDLTLSSEQWRWLRKHNHLTIASWAPNVPPYFMNAGRYDYVGITADYLGLLASNLNIKLEIQQYADKKAAFEALENGEADLIAWASDEAYDAGFLLSKPYTNNTPAEVVNFNAWPLPEEGVRLAIDAAYPNPEAFIQRWPQAQLIPFISARHALEALAFHQIDIFIGDATATQYLINESNLSDLNIRRLRNNQSKGFSFAARPDNEQLIAIINQVLSAIPANINEDIMRRWNGGFMPILSERHLYFTSLEQKWIEDNPEIRVSVLRDSAPLSIYDSKKKLHGVTTDILKAIGLRTGLKFVIQPKDNLEEIITAVKSGHSDMVASLNLDSASHASLLTTRTWLFNSWVMVGRHPSLSLPATHRAMLLKGNAVDLSAEPELQKMRIVQADTLTEGLEAVVKGKADVMILPLINANFYISRLYADKLHIIKSLEIDPARFTMAVSASNYPLATILDKALLNIAPEDLQLTVRKWHSNANMPNDRQSEIQSAPSQALIGLAVVAAGMILTLLILLLRHRQRRQPAQQHLLDAIPVPLFITDLNGRLTSANRSFAEALNIDVNEHRGQNVQALMAEFGLYDGDRVKEGIAFWQTLLQTNALGYGYVGGWQDMRESLQTLKQLQQAKHSAEKASRVKTTFLASISHELRTPLSAIIGILELLLRRKQLNPGDRDSLHIAYDTAESLLMLVGDIIDVARIETERLVLRPERASIRPLIESVVTMMDGLARQKSLLFTCEIDADISGDVLVDPVRFKQILINILGNAVKFTVQGRIIFQALLEKEEASALNLVLTIQDSGPGIDAATQARLFKPFEQGDNQQSQQGSGLGLYICRTLINMMAGELTLDSQPGMGTEVTIRLRLPRMTPQPMPAVVAAAQAAPTTARRILVVDDHAASRHVLIQQLHYLGHEAIGAADGQQALSLLSAQLPDVVITDCNMPVMDGFALTHAIRRDHPDLIIWGATANKQQSVREACLNAGMNDCLFKPLTLQTLEKSLSTLPVTETPPCNIAWKFPPGLNTPLKRRHFLQLQLEMFDEALADIHEGRQHNRDLKSVLHKLRGGLLLLGADELIEACQQLEKQPDPEKLQQFEQQIVHLSRHLQLIYAGTTDLSSLPTAG
ncbi:Virulence sensor protein BvgS [Mixta theicola]|nr:transporter substrate-binding domain-containing protein [Mixta theicola]QHM77978.1 Virulence sensor protein BvgS [Mixta theicola]